ncbi:ProQ/FinO family protein [Caballeronia sp. LZ035]|uniref:ProQ/FinO family protein n=1 Tax=Caballeronia sp. LZ035 TaxID=3038568 RepID=UPI00285EBED0|nr:ProQ/FinO family protein [Caballeronia sp. LZ035]MDR5758525.1 ProQ/FinO family protein [Caballeronia sp. LZ035]
MGFEQLAGLKKQLAQQARQAEQDKGKDKAAKAKKPPRARRAPAPTPPPPPAAPAKPVDPVVHTIGKLQKRFPLAFPKNPAPKKPLKVGIFEDLMKHAEELQLSERELRAAIKVWCRGNRYWTSLAEGAPRVDLTGAAAGEVTSADAARAVYLENNRQARSTTATKSAKAAEAPKATEATEAPAATEAAETPEADAKPSA